jgi:hypothetical protein
MLECWNVGMLGCVSGGMLDRWSAIVFDWRSVRMCECYNGSVCLGCWHDGMNG